MRDPSQVFARYGRQLLVDGVDFDGQARLHALGAVVGHDASAVATAGAEACARYLVGAGVGRLAGATAWATALTALDPDLVLFTQPTLVAPPLVRVWVAEAVWGASVDVIWTPASDATPEVTSLRLDLGAPAGAELGVALGAVAADVILRAVLGLAPMPADVHLDWTDPNTPLRTETPRLPSNPAVVVQTDGPFLAALETRPDVRATLVAAAEAAYPLEACGVVVQRADGRWHAVVGENLQDALHAHDPEQFQRTARSAFQLDTRLLVREVDAGGQILAIWHSHCDAQAYFSAEDVRGAAPDGLILHPELAHVVVSVYGNGQTDMAAYRVVAVA